MSTITDRTPAIDLVEEARTDAPSTGAAVGGGGGPSRTAPVLAWTAVALALVAALVLAAVALVPGDGTSSDLLDGTSWPEGVPASADAADRWLEGRVPAGRAASVPASADAAERWLQGRVPSGRAASVPASADAAERWLAD